MAISCVRANGERQRVGDGGVFFCVRVCANKWLALARPHSRVRAGTGGGRGPLCAVKFLCSGDSLGAKTNINSAQIDESTFDSAHV